MIITTVIHPLYHPRRKSYGSVGKYQYLLINGKLRISIISIRIDDRYVYEIFGNMMECEHRFDTLDEAIHSAIRRLS